MSFRPAYFALPAAILLLSIILVAFFYRLLPPEVAYRFSDGEPAGWINRGAIIAWLIIPQLILVFVGVSISRGTIILSSSFGPGENTPIRKVLLIMGNMVALPQIILAFAMLDIFLYNAYQIHLMQLWVFAVIVMGLGGIILGIFFVQTVRRFRELPDKNLQE